MAGVAAHVRCPACGSITAERVYCTEHWDGWLRTCHACGHQGLDVTLVPERPGEWSPDPESIE